MESLDSPRVGKRIGGRLRGCGGEFLCGLTRLCALCRGKHVSQRVHDLSPVLAVDTSACHALVLGLPTYENGHGALENVIDLYREACARFLCWVKRCVVAHAKRVGVRVSWAALRSIETTWNKRDERWFPHVHIVLKVADAVWHEIKSLLASVWRDEVGCQGAWVVAEPLESAQAIIAYLLKGDVLSGNVPLDGALFGEHFHATRRKRLVATSGDLRGKAKEEVKLPRLLYNARKALSLLGDYRGATFDDEPGQYWFTEAQVELARTIGALRALGLNSSEIVERVRRELDLLLTERTVTNMATAFWSA